MRDIRSVSHYTTITCQSLDPAADFYAACSDSGVVAVWTVQSLLEACPDPKPVFTFQPFNGLAVYSLSSTQRFLIVGGRGEIRAWAWKELAARNPKPAWGLHVGANHRRPQINWMDTNKQNESCDILAVGCGDNEIYMYDLESRDLTKVLSGHTNFVHSVDFGDGSGGVGLVSGGEDGAVKLWDTRSSRSEIHSFVPDEETDLKRPGLGKFISSVSTGGDWLVCGGGPAASLWNLSTRIMSSRLPPESGSVHAIQMLEEDIYIAGQNSSLHKSNFGGEDCGTMRVSPTCIYSIVSNIKKDIVLSAGASSTIDLFSIKSNTKLKSLHFPLIGKF
eukprot:TRINITY_DN32344_c0_g1_i1.p1 TRINITY_DN32344_c0_g1~~TRINITY_DN32344_c0_g1_i1.p1  ORF type:complete len:342 (-),score=39.20 TRINITY_DN32344_c0_g1_i1:30-1028(-)